jgi:TRAP-type uncharacterized transport system substrate-binding protein
LLNERNAGNRKSPSSHRTHIHPCGLFGRDENLGVRQLQEKMRFRSPAVIVPLSAFLLVTVLYVAYFLIDPIPPKRFVIAAATPSSGYDAYAKQYQKILAHNGISLEIRNSAGALENLSLLRDASTGVQAALTTFGSVEDADANDLYSLGGTFDTPFFVFYRSPEPITSFAQFQGKRLAVGPPGTALRASIMEALKVTEIQSASNDFLDVPNTQAADELIAGRADVGAIPQGETGSFEKLLAVPDIRLMDIGQAEAIAKSVPGLKHLILSRGLIDLRRDIPHSNVDILAFRNRLLVRKSLHPALQYLLLEAMRDVHWQAGPFNTIGEFPAEQPNDLPLSPTAQAFYRSGPTLLQRYTWFWLSSLLDRIAFFGLPVFLALIPIIGFGLSLHRWLLTRQKP